MAAKNYNEDSIKVLKPIDAIRKRPGMYIGSTDHHGVLHIAKEVIDNAIDEALAGHNNYVGVAIDGNSVWVADNGRGIPTGIHKTTKESTLISLFTYTHAGGKFDDKSYDGSIGTHGVGAKATNALSQSLRVWTSYTGKWEAASFERGKLLGKGVFKTQKPKLPKGLDGNSTIIQFTPDKDIFGKAANDMAFLDSGIHALMRMSSYLNPKIKFVFVDRKGERHEYLSKRGLPDYIDKRVEELGRKNKMKAVAQFYHSDKQMDCCISFLDTDIRDTEFYTNTSFNPQGGTHETRVFRPELFNALFEFAKRGDVFEAVDCQSFLIGAFNVKVSEPRFSSQTKEKLDDSRVVAYAEPLFDALYKFFSKNKSLAAQLIEAACEKYEERHSVKNDKKLAKEIRDLSKSKTLLPGKLTVAHGCKPEKRELFLVEGDSAGGPAKKARYAEYQEVLTLKGKPINAAKADLSRVTSNEEIINILVALGYNPTAKDVYESLRVKGKLVFLVDPDVDGSHISLLLLALFSVMLPQLFVRGLVYIAITPEYMATYKGKRYYGRGKADLEKALPKGAKVEFQHIKGWGEVAPEVLRDVAFEDSTRVLKQVSVKDAKEIAEFVGLMGENIELRRELIGIDLGDV